jgi:membrane-bound hydrogenase subunit beta
MIQLMATLPGGFTIETVEPEGLITSFKARFGRQISEARQGKVRSNLGDYVYPVIWFDIEREALHDAIAYLKGFQFPHLATISGRDLGKEIELIYHLSIGYGEWRGEQSINFRLTLPKIDLKVRSICDLIPGAQTAEREKIEFLGVQFEGIPDSRNLFLPEGMERHPWRKDE